jgi:hypothetical protein
MPHAGFISTGGNLSKFSALTAFALASDLGRCRFATQLDELEVALRQHSAVPQQGDLHGVEGTHAVGVE